MPLPALLLILATLLPLGSFAVLLFVGKRMGRPLAGVLGTVAIGGSMACSLAALAVWLNAPPGNAWGAGIGPVVRTVAWLPVGTDVGGAGGGGTGYLDVGVYVDSLTIAMFAMITLVATLVHVFSLGYMADDPRYPRFFTYLGLFCFSMMGLVIAGTTLQVFVFWELVGLCSYLLIGFWHDRKPAADAARKAFVMNRVGDVGFLVGFGILFYHLGNMTLPHLWSQLGDAGLMQAGQVLSTPGGATVSYGMLTAAGVLLFFGAMGKSAQFPLHTWLPDAMEGPTPVSALIHAATMVAAGVYLVGRIFPILTPDAKLFIAIIGATTLTMAALIACVQSDLKKVLAYSTISQLGYMMLAIGIGSWVGGLFHLVTHAFFKALLFLGAGGVIHAAHHEQDMRQYGGLFRRVPITAATFAVGVLAIAGTPWLSGYYSKTMILTHAAGFGLLADASGRGWGYWLLFILPAGVAYLTAFYMARCWMLTFAGRPRNLRLHARAEEPWILYTPLLALAVMTVIAGRWLGVEYLLTRSVVEAQRHVQLATPDRPFRGFETAWPVVSPTEASASAAVDPDAMPATDEPALDGNAPTAAALDGPSTNGAAPAAAAASAGAAERLERRWAGWAFAAGIGLAVAMYWNGYAVADRLMRVAPVRWVHRWLYNKMYFDELYLALVVGLTNAAAALAAAADRHVVDRVVDGVGGATRRLATASRVLDDRVVDGAATAVGALALQVGRGVRAPQTGRIRAYVTALVLLAVIGLAGAVMAMIGGG